MFARCVTTMRRNTATDNPARHGSGTTPKNQETEQAAGKANAPQIEARETSAD